MKAFFAKLGKTIKSHKIITTAIVLFLVGVMITFPCLFASFRAEIPEFYDDRISEGIVPTSEQVSAVDKYERVIIFGIDGAGAYFKEGVTPNFDRIFSSGSVSYEGISQHPTSSGENWASMFTGLPVQKHKINNSVSFLFPNTLTPTIFKICHQNDKKATFASVCNWRNINYGIIENCCNVKKINCKGKAGKADVDSVVRDYAIKRIQNNNDKIIFMQYDSVDHAGHNTGYGSEEYIATLQTVDGYMGAVYDACVEKGWLDTTLFICVSDHGHKLTGGHGGEEPTEKQITFAVAGNKGNIIKGTMGKMVTQDVASVVLYALGIEQPSSFESKVPYNVFSSLQ